MFLNKAEDAANTEYSDDGSHDSQVLSDSSPGDYENNGSKNDYCEIELVPGILKVVGSMGDNFNDSFDGEDKHEEVVDDIDWSVKALRLHVPNKAKDESVAHDTDHNKVIEVLVVSKIYAPVANPAFTCC